MKKATLILAAIAAALAAVAAAPAQAGSKRLQFGGPLGSFEATPYAKSSNRGHSGYSNKRSSYAAKKAAARRAAAKKAAARKYAAQKAAKKTAARQLAAQKEAAQRAAARKIADKKAAAAQARNLAKADGTEEKSETTAAVTKNAPVKASAIAGTNTLEFEQTADDTDLAALDETKTPSVESEKEVKDDAVSEKAELECKKYIPSAGMTITVPCGS